MSREYYAQWWVKAKGCYEKLVAQDEAIRKSNDTVKDKCLANQLLGGLYAKYARSVREIGSCLDQMVHPQRRITCRKLYDSATIRLQELNTELRKIDISEYHYIDGTLIELKLIPKEIEVLDPFYPPVRPEELEILWTRIKNGETIYVPPPPPPEELTPSQMLLTQKSRVTFAEGDASQQPPEKEEDENKTEDQKEKPTEKEGAKSAESEEEKPSENADDKEDDKSKKKKRPKKFQPPQAKPLTAEELEELKKKELVSAMVKILQTQERGRQARLYFSELQSISQLKKRMRYGYKPPEIDPKVQEQAAVKMQSIWRSYCARKYIKRKEKERRFLIRMIEPSWKSKAEFEILEKNLAKRRELRDQRIREYLEAIINERIRVFRVIAPRLFEDIGDEIREWFYQWYQRAKTFDNYPPETKGGTIMVIRMETMTPEEYIDDVEKKRREKVKNKGKDKAKLKEEARKKKEAAKKAKEKEKARKKKEAEMKKQAKKKKKFTEFEYEFQPTQMATIYQEGIKEHMEWDKRPEDPEERHYMDIITDAKCHEMQLEVRVQVDELMRLELELLVDALARDKAKGKKNKKKPKKKGGKKKGKKGKMKKDPTGNRTTEDLFQELVDASIIHPYDKARLCYYKGDFSYNNWEKRLRDFDPPATLGDVRQAVKINCVLPLCVETMKKHRSVLIAGCRQSGKKLLANAIFTETQCVLFDLSPENLAGKYEGKKGMKMLLHLINKMSRLLQPSIIYFNAAEKIFYKKVPKEEKEMDPKRIGKKLFKGIIKPIKPEDRIMVLGITGQPWLASPAKLKKNFERIILIPRPDYGSIYLHWREILMTYHSVERNFEISPLAKLTEFYPLTSLTAAAKKVLNAKRIAQLSYKPLDQRELLEVLLTEEPITDKEYNKFLKFYKKTPLGKERAKFNKFADAQREQEARALEKANKNKK